VPVKKEVDILPTIPLLSNSTEATTDRQPVSRTLVQEINSSARQSPDGTPKVQVVVLNCLTKNRQLPLTQPKNNDS